MASIDFPSTFRCLRLTLIPLAMKAYGVTEKEILTLPHEIIPGSRKKFFACADVGALALRKANFFDATVSVPERDAAKPVSPGLISSIRVLFEKMDTSNRARKANFHETSAYRQIVKETGVSPRSFGVSLSAN